jgi:hypothetical protein
LRERALDVYRKKYGLLTADEIRSLRERFGLTQAELAHCCGSDRTRSRDGRRDVTRKRQRWTLNRWTERAAILACMGRRGALTPYAIQATVAVVVACSSYGAGADDST